MKICNTPIFNKKIKSAIRKIQREKIQPPGDGMMICLFDTYTQRGKWQVDYIYDTRRRAKPYIAAFYFDTQNQQDNYAKAVKYKEYQLK